jgi:hypothetical protein
MNYYLVVSFSFSVFIGAVIGWIRYKKIDACFTPFIICLSVAAINEICSFIMTRAHITTAYNNNLYVLFEAMLITWQFKNWGLFNQSRLLFIVLMIMIPAAWIIENCMIFHPSQISVYFRIGYSYLIVMMSVNVMSTLILTVRNSLFRSPEFIICLGFIIYFTNKIVFEAFWLYGLNASRLFTNTLYFWLIWINLIVNLFYAVAMLWIPKKPQFITPF